MLTSDVKLVIEGQIIKSLDGQLVKRLSYAEIAILVALINAKGEVVSRDELISLGWPGKIVGPNSLNMAILALRRHLDAFGMSENIITIPRVGFSLAKYQLFSCVEAQEISDIDIENVDYIDNSNISEECLYSAPSSTPRQKIIFPTRPDGGANTYGNIRAHLVGAFFFILFIFNMFVFLLYESHKPDLVCEVFERDVNVCATEITEKVKNVASNYLSNIEIKGKAILLVEKNPHNPSGYEFYFLGLE